MAKARSAELISRSPYDLLAPVYAWFTEGFGTKDLKEARAVLDELKARNRASDRRTLTDEK